MSCCGAAIAAAPGLDGAAAREDDASIMISSNPVVVIPARLAATRLPNKPLADIHGEPMIVHVWRRSVEARISVR
jgi:hypothetical protein